MATIIQEADTRTQRVAAPDIAVPDIAVPDIAVPDIAGHAALDADAVLRRAGLSAVYVNKAGEASDRPPLGRRVETQMPAANSSAQARATVTVYTD